MGVSYSKEQRARAKETGLHLITIDAAGLAQQMAVPEEERDALLQYVLDLRIRLRARAKDAGADLPKGA